MDPMDYDAELRLHNEVLRLACDISRHDRVLVVGLRSRTARRVTRSRIAASGSAVGVDISAAMIARNGCSPMRRDCAMCRLSNKRTRMVQTCFAYGALRCRRCSRVRHNVLRRSHGGVQQISVAGPARPRDALVIGWFGKTTKSNDGRTQRASRGSATDSPSGRAQPVLARRPDHGRADPQRAGLAEKRSPT